MNEKKDNGKDIEKQIHEKMINEEKERELKKIKERQTVFTKLILIFEFCLFLFSLFFLIIGLKVFLGVFLMGSFLFFLILTLISLFSRRLRPTFWLPTIFVFCIMSLVIFITVVNIPFANKDIKETAVEEVSEQNEAIEEPAPEETTEELPEEESETSEQFKASCNIVSYDELLRYPEKYEGKRINIKGYVVQTTNYGFLHINIIEDESGFSDDRTFLYLPEDSPRIIEKDIIEVWGFGGGVETYETVLGSENTIPVINAEYITILDKTTSDTESSSSEEEDILEETVEGLEPSQNEYGPGMYIVNDDIEPGIYRSESGVTYFERLAGLSGELDDILANEASPSGPVYVEIKSTDVAFKTEGSGKWYKIELDEYKGNMLTSFGDGWYIVSKDIIPGRYRSDGGSVYWARLKDFSGELNSIITNSAFDEGTIIVEIQSSDFGFRTLGADWEKID